MRGEAMPHKITTVKRLNCEPKERPTHRDFAIRIFRALIVGLLAIIGGKIHS